MTLTSKITDKAKQVPSYEDLHIHHYHIPQESSYEYSAPRPTKDKSVTLIPHLVLWTKAKQVPSYKDLHIPHCY